MTNILDLDREYLQAVLSWLDNRLERDVKRWQLAGQNPSDRFRGLYISQEEAAALSQRKAGTHWGSGIALPQEEERRLQKKETECLAEMDRLEKEAADHGQELRLKSLQNLFGLNTFEWQAFVVCLAPHLDLRYERIYGYLQDDVTRIHASVDLILNLLAPEGLSRLDFQHYFEPQMPLCYFRLLLPVEDSKDHSSRLRQAFTAAPGVIDWLLGAYSPMAALGEWAQVSQFSEEQTREALQDLADASLPSMAVLRQVKPFLSLHGDDFLQQEMTAQQLAAGLGRPLLKVVFSENEDPESAMKKLLPALRDARMLNALFYLQGCDIFVDKDGYLDLACAEALSQNQECVLLSSKLPFKFNPATPKRDHPLMYLPFERLSSAERKQLWETMLEGVLDEIPGDQLRILAGQFAFTSGQIIAAASTALSRAVQESRSLQAADLFEAARLHSGHHLAELAHKIEPRYTWDDLVLPETPMTMLKEMVSMVQVRSQVLEDWGLGEKLTASAGVSVLFSGPPGTGKTLAAQIIANQLGIDLYRIDLSNVVSKYVGETEKNLERIFTEAAESNAILFFDEADAIFGKRSEVKDAHDRYANIEVGYLLQRMENYDGVAILATNLRANLDEAFTRRLQFIINFPFPDEQYRKQIWKVLMPANLPQADDLDLNLMAKRFKLAGGSIRNIIVSAAFQAAADGGVVTMPMLMHGAKREIQKMGKLLQEADFIL